VTVKVILPRDLILRVFSQQAGAKHKICQKEARRSATQQIVKLIRNEQNRITWRGRRKSRQKTQARKYITACGEEAKIVTITTEAAYLHTRKGYSSFTSQAQSPRSLW
jgi:hypothetical protein